MKTLLAILTNPSDSDKFIRYTINMSADLGYNLHIMYVQNPALYTIDSGTDTTTPHPVANELDVKMLEADRDNALNYIKEIVAGFKDSPKPKSTDVSAEAGTMSTVVNHLVSHNKAHMIVAEGDEDGGFFSSEPDVIRKTKCPGWIIPPKMSYRPYIKILYATDYNEADITTLKRLVALTKMFSPEITALHITDSPNFEKKTMQKGFKDVVAQETNYNKIVVKTEKEDKSIEERINHTAINIKADLIVLLKENKGFIEKIFTSSSTKKVIKKAKLPVLVYHE